MRKFKFRALAVIFTTMLLVVTSVIPALAQSGTSYFVPPGLLSRGFRMNAVLLKSTHSDANSAAKSFSFFPVRQVIGTLVAVDANAETINVKQIGARRVINASDALVVLVGSNGRSRQGSLSELSVGSKVHVYVLRGLDQNRLLQATLIVQFTSRIIPPPNVVQPVIQFDASSSRGSEVTPSVSLPLRLNQVSGANTNIHYRVTGSATGNGTDYTLAEGDVLVPAGQMTANIMLPIVNDSLSEDNETVVVTLSSTSNGSIGGRNVYTYTILDDDQPSVSFDAASHGVVEGTATYAHTVTLSGPSENEVKVKYYVTGSATGGGVDYSLSNGELVFPAGSTSASIGLSVNDDSIDEADESVVIVLYGPMNAHLGSIPVHTHTIQDND